MQAIWRLSNEDLAKARRASVMLRRLGLLFYLVPFLVLIALIALLMDAMQGAFPWFIAFWCFAWLMVFYCPAGYVLRNVRTLSARRQLRNLAVAHTASGFLASVMVLQYALEGHVFQVERGFCIWIVIPSIIWLVVFRHCRNPHLFAKEPCSSAEVEFIALNRPRLEAGAEIAWPARYRETALGAAAYAGCLVSYLWAAMRVVLVYVYLYETTRGGG